MPQFTVAARADPNEERKVKERSYTVAEIDRMRSAVEHEWLFGCKKSQRDPNLAEASRSYKEEVLTKCVEEQLRSPTPRTYMLAGIDPKELE